MEIKNIILTGFVMVILLFNIISIEVHASDSQKIRIGVDKNIPPYSYIENGELKGFNVDILKAMGGYMKYSIDVVPMDWDSAVDALLEGSIDALCGMVPTPERNNSFDFSEEYISLDYYIFQNKNITSIKNISDINRGYTVVVIKDDISENYVENNLKNVTIIESADTLNALIMLDKGIADVFVGAIRASSYFISKMDLHNVKLTNLEVIICNAAIAVKKGNKNILNEIIYSLNKIKENGEYTNIYSKWFSQGNTAGEKWYPYFIYTLYVGVGILVALGILFVHDRVGARKINRLEEIQKILLRNIPVGIIFLRDSEIYYINNYALKILGIKRGNVNRLDVGNWLDKKGEVNIQTKYGEKWLIISSVEYKDRKMVTFVDITANKIMELRDKVRFQYVNDILDKIRTPVQNILTASERIENKEMQEIIKNNVKKLSEILRKEFPE